MLQQVAMAMDSSSDSMPFVLLGKNLKELRVTTTSDRDSLSRVCRSSLGTDGGTCMGPAAGGGDQPHLLTSGSLTARARNAAPFIIGVAGGTASGKTTVCDLVAQRLNDSCVVMLSQDAFYRDLNEEDQARAHAKNYNFDVPDAFDVPLILKCLMDLKAGRCSEVPSYDFTRHARDLEGGRRVEPADVIIIEGILILAMPEIRALLNMKVFVDTDDDLRLGRRIQRDVAERGRDVAGVIEQYTKFVKPAFDQFIGPSRRHADVVIPWHCQGGERGENVVAIDLITEHIKGKLQQPELRRFFRNLEVIPSSFQIRAMHTVLRNHLTSKNEFVFVADRLIRLVVEAGLGFLPFTEVQIRTPCGAPYVGVETVPIAEQLCGVSIIRSGESMENALRACCQGVKLGKILVRRTLPAAGTSYDDDGERRGWQQEGGDRPHRMGERESESSCTPSSRGRGGSAGEGGEEDILYEKLPADIAQRFVLLMDPVLSTGHSIVKAVESLLSKGVLESRILLLCIIAAPEGIQRVCGRFPQMKVITSEIESHVEGDNYTVVPGVGNFGDRYFCE